MIPALLLYGVRPLRQIVFLCVLLKFLPPLEVLFCGFVPRIVQWLLHPSIRSYHGTPKLSLNWVSINNDGLNESSKGMLGAGLYTTTEVEKALAFGWYLYLFEGWSIQLLPRFFDPLPFCNFGLSFIDPSPEGVIVLPDNGTDKHGFWRKAGFRAAYRPHAAGYRSTWDELCIEMCHMQNHISKVGDDEPGSRSKAMFTRSVCCWLSFTHPLLRRAMPYSLCVFMQALCSYRSVFTYIIFARLWLK